MSRIETDNTPRLIYIVFGWFGGQRISGVYAIKLCLSTDGWFTFCECPWHMVAGGFFEVIYLYFFCIIIKPVIGSNSMRWCKYSLAILCSTYNNIHFFFISLKLFIILLELEITFFYFKAYVKNRKNHVLAPNRYF